MFIEICLICCGIHVADKVYKKIGKTGTDWSAAAEKTSPPVTMQAVEKNIRAAEKKINQRLQTGSVSLGLAVTGQLVYPPLALLSIPGILLHIIPICGRGYHAFVRERRICMDVLDAITVPFVLLLSNLVIVSIVCILIALSEKLRIRAKEYSERSMTDIFAQQTGLVWIVRDGLEIEVPLESLEIDETVVVDAGQTIPIDGIVTDGYALIDQHILTGESHPVEKERGDEIFASTTVTEGRVFIQVKKLGSETVAANICHILRNTTDFKSGVQLKGEEFGDKAVGPLLGLAALALPAVGPGGVLAVLNAPLIGVLRLTAPLSVLNFLRIASQRGMLIKDGRALELLSSVDTVIFDKTGTLTLEEPHVGAVYTFSSWEEDDVLRYAAATEYKQTHPIAKALVREAWDRQLDLPETENVKYSAGYGIEAIVEQLSVSVGSRRFMEQSGVPLPPEISRKQEECNKSGSSLVYVAINSSLAGALELLPTLRPETETVIRELTNRGFEIYILSGDHKHATENMAKQLGIPKYFSEVLPEDKAKIIAELQQQGKKICFVGDGINDALALKTANVSVSLRGASTVATDSAGIILMDGHLSQLIQVIDLAEQLDSNMKSNLALSITPGIICITGAFFFHFGILSAIMLYTCGLVAGAGNAMLPLLKAKNT